MPIYEYSCNRCDHCFQTLVMGVKEAGKVSCPGCGGRDLKKLISRVAFHLSEQERIDRFNPGAARDDAFYKDSRNIGLQAKKRARQMGVDLGSGFDEKLEKLRTDPGSVIKDSE